MPPFRGESDFSPLATTDANGRFPLPELKVGEQTVLSISASGFMPLTDVKAYRDQDGYKSDESMSGKGWPVRLTPAATLSGRVLGPDGKPLAGAPLCLEFQWSSRGFRTGGDLYATSDREGRFAIENVPPGRQILEYSAASTNGPRKLPVEGVFAYLVVKVEEGDQQVPDLVLDLSQCTASIEGQVFGPDGKPLAGATVNLAQWVEGSGDNNRSPCNWPPPKTDGQGRYKLTGLGPGSWRLWPSDPRFGPFGAGSVATLSAGQDAALRLADRGVQRRYRAGRLPRRGGGRADGQSRQSRSWAADPGSDARGNGRDPAVGRGGSVPAGPGYPATPSSPGQVEFADLGIGCIGRWQLSFQSAGLPPTASPEELASASHVGQLYFATPASLVAVNGTTIVPLAPPPLGGVRGVPNSYGQFVPDFAFLRNITRSQLAEQFSASRREAAKVDGRRIAVKQGGYYLVARRDSAAFLVFVRSADRASIRLVFVYLGHVPVAKAAAAGEQPRPAAQPSTGKPSPEAGAPPAGKPPANGEAPSTPTKASLKEPWHLLAAGKLAAVEVERVMYKMEGTAHHFVHVRVTNRSDKTIGVDLRDNLETIYENSWSDGPTDHRDTTDGIRWDCRHLDGDALAALRGDFAAGKLTAVPAGKAVDYYRGAYGIAQPPGLTSPVADIHGYFFIVSLNGRQLATDGATVEQLSCEWKNGVGPEQTDLVLPSYPPPWKTIPADARVIDDDLPMGQVVDDRGRGIAKATVKWCGAFFNTGSAPPLRSGSLIPYPGLDHLQFSPHATTNADGRFPLPDLAVGEMTVLSILRFRVQAPDL